ncbi:MAG: carbonate dehydratase [Bacteroidota bacterium]
MMDKVRAEKDYQQLLLQNKVWVEQRNQEDPEFFSRLSGQQSPKFLWIGCSDSRVPANQITGTDPGEIFVHRNIANMVVHTDMNMLSVLDYAVNVLMVEHVIVCGHYGCGGVRAAMGQKQFGIIDNWIRHIKDVYRLNEKELDAIKDPLERENKFIEMNVIEQVLHLCKTSIVQNAWEKRQGPYVHGWVYSISEGLIKDLDVTFHDNSELPEVFKFKY